MVTVSLCMIVKNEEDVLARCLDSVKDAVDEIIIVDTGSIDKTKTIARQYTKKVFDFKWCDNFSAARNFSYSKATKDYQLWLDADDVVPPESLEQLKRLKTALDPEIEIVTMKYITHFDDKDNPILTSVRERLTKMSKNYQWIDPVHECIPLIGKQLISDITIHHRKIHKDKTADRNLHIYQALEKSGEPLSPRQQYYFARELKDHGELQKAIYYFEKFLDSKQGWVEDNIAACFNLALCHNALGDTSRVLASLIRSFAYDAPRPEICAEIGYYHKQTRDFKKALQWFGLATKLADTESMGFVLWDYRGYIPNIECCVCCVELGEYENAHEYNECAAEFKPDSPAIEFNRKVLAKKLAE